MGIVERACTFSGDGVIAARSAAANGSALCDAGAQEPSLFETVQRGVNRSRVDVSLQGALHAMEDGPAVGIRTQLQDGEQDCLFESTKNLGHTYIVGMAIPMSSKK